jgi:hypothetical protein
VAVTTEDELRLEIENIDLGRLLAQAGIDAAEHKGERAESALSALAGVKR